MNRKIPYDRGLMLIVLALLGFGLVIVFSASSVVSKEIYGSQTHIFTRQFISVVLGLLLLFLAMKIDYHTYARRTVIYAMLIGAGALLILPLLSAETNGARRWVSLGPANFQPSELAKLVIICFTAYYLVRKKDELNTFRTGLLPYLGVLGSIVLLILLELDLGTPACIVLTAGVLLYLGGLDYRYYLACVLTAGPLFYLLVLRVPYRRNRILAFMDPGQDPYGMGYQIRQSLIAVGSGGWNGLGFAEGKQKLFFLPEPHTDFIFAVIGEELGLTGCAALVVLFVLLFWRGIRVSLRADTPFGTFLGVGIVCMIVLQAFINMSVAISLMPTKGIPLPFISVGGSSMLIMLMAIGVLLNISRHSRGSEERSCS
ncbi:MAG: putative lipid II flippase FtsW [Acidobacteriota bacterium]